MNFSFLKKNGFLLPSIIVLIDINLLQINSERGRIPNSIQTFRPLYFWRFLLSVISILLSHYYIFTHNSFSIYYPDSITHTLFCDCRFFSDGFLLVVYILEDFGSMHRRTIKIRKSPCVFFLTYTCIWMYILFVKKLIKDVFISVSLWMYD